MKPFLMILLVGLLYSGEALGRYGDTGGGLWILAIPLAIINLIIDLWVPLLIFGAYIFIRYIYPEMKNKKKD